MTQHPGEGVFFDTLPAPGETTPLGGVNLNSGVAANLSIGNFIRTDADGAPEGVGLLAGFYQWALNTGADPNPDISGLAYMNFLDAENEKAQRAAGGPGRVQFESERRLQEEQALSEQFNRQNALATGKIGALQNVDQLRQGGRESAVNALVNAAPFIVGPERVGGFTPGFEPGGIAEVLGQLLGANVPNQLLNTETLPLEMLRNAPLEGGPQTIEDLFAAVQAGV